MSRLEEAVNDADIILEVIKEDIELKKDLLESKLTWFSSPKLGEHHDYALTIYMLGNFAFIFLI